MTSYKIILIFLGVLFSASTFALATDREQPILIEADKATIDNLKGVAIYEGNVIVKQGSIGIDANTVTLNYTDKQEIETVVAVGKPAHFKQHLDGGDVIKAKAGEMQYHAVEDKLELREEAELRKIKEGKDIYTSNAPRIIYDTKRGIIKADQGRVFVKIQPQRKSSPKK